MEDIAANNGGEAPEKEMETSLRRRVSEVIAGAGGPSAVSRVSGIPKGTLEKYAAATATPSIVRAALIAKSLGMRLDDLASSENFDAAPARGLTDLDQPDMIRLPVYSEVHASAGPGSVPVSERADGVIAFERRFLRDQGAAPEKCSLIWARGTSMKPTIPDGSILVVDHSQRSVENGCIYVFNVCDRIVVKRARWRMDGRLELVSDNTAEGYPVKAFGPDAAADLRVVGRVVYFCRTP